MREKHRKKEIKKRKKERKNKKIESSQPITFEGYFSIYDKKICRILWSTFFI